MNESLISKVSLDNLLSQTFVKKDLREIIKLDDKNVNVEEFKCMHNSFRSNYCFVFCGNYDVNYDSYRSGELSESDIANLAILYHDADIFYKSLLSAAEKHRHVCELDKLLLEKATSEIIEPEVSRRRLGIILGLLCAVTFFGGGTLFIVAFVKKLSFMLRNLNIYNALMTYKICGLICYAIAIATTIIALIYVVRSTHTINVLTLQIQDTTYWFLPKRDLKTIEERLEIEFHYQIESHD
jgi:hypothetical protein